MITLSCSGTLGDTFVTVCKLYHLAQKKPVQVNHYTIHTMWRNKIREIYSLLPNVTVNFVDKRDVTNSRIYSDFTETQDAPWGINYFPEFKFADHRRFGLPDRYAVIASRSGKPHEKARAIPHALVNDAIRSFWDAQRQVVLVGAERDPRIDTAHAIDLIGETTLLEVMQVVKMAEQCLAFQGLLAYVALSQRVSTNIYVRTNDDIHAVKCYVAEQWRAYCKEVIQVK